MAHCCKKPRPRLNKTCVVVTLAIRESRNAGIKEVEEEAAEEDIVQENGRGERTYSQASAEQAGAGRRAARRKESESLKDNSIAREHDSGGGRHPQASAWGTGAGQGVGGARAGVGGRCREHKRPPPPSSDAINGESRGEPMVGEEAGVCRATVARRNSLGCDRPVIEGTAREPSCWMPKPCWGGYDNAARIGKCFTGGFSRAEQMFCVREG